MLQLISKKIILLIPILLFFYSCDDITRDNILDPKNPDSYRQFIITVDAFVNTNNSLPYNEYLLSALDQLEINYPNRISIAEYHRNAGGIDDTLEVNEIEPLYNLYLNGVNSSIKGVPDVFINGIAARVQGASSAANALFRLEEAIVPLLSENSFFTIEPKLKWENNTLNISAKIARLGSSSANDIIVKAVIVEMIDQLYHKRVVRKIIRSNEFSNFGHGEQEDVELDPYPGDVNADLNVILSVTSKDELTVHQSIEVTVP